MRRDDSVNVEYERAPEHMFLVAEALNQVHLVQGLTAEQRAKLCSQVTFMEVGPGKQVCQHGEGKQRLFILLEGKVLSMLY